ncbi:hypothetical protein KSX_36910 [Ktedonospora formicarum]|uniref:Uncharacterized protein n=1 Tax=Ktedonospora formicarum TaxID=2778364 RepID=A0A8J3I3Y1_9CHLR|nr:hypothetical protein KSX_36910 [Ktedonospora formicarum]
MAWFGGIYHQTTPRPFFYSPLPKPGRMRYNTVHCEEMILEEHIPYPLAYALE